MSKKIVISTFILLILAIAGCQRAQPAKTPPVESVRFDEPKPRYEPLVARQVKVIEENAASIRVVVHPEGGGFFTFAKDSSKLPASREHGAQLTEEDAAALAKLLAGDPAFFWQPMTADGPPNTFILIYGPDIDLQASLGSKEQAAASLSKVRNVLKDAAARNLMEKIVKELGKQPPKTASPKDWDKELEKMSKECIFVVLGRVKRIASDSHPGGKTVSVGTIEVQRHLKGISDVKTLECEFRFESLLYMEPDTEDVIWFVRKRLGSGRYLITHWRWGKDSLDWILSVIARVDKTTRIPDMPKPPPSKMKKGITVSLAADDGRGRAQTSVRAKSLREIKLLAQFENHAEESQSVMPCLDGSIVHWRYPHYDLEVLDDSGATVQRKIGVRCGNINALRARDIVPLMKGEVFRTKVSTYGFALKPGKYTIRLKYTAKRDTSAEGRRLREDDKEVKDLIKAVWEGTTVSNWIDVEIVNKPDKSGK